MAIFNKIRWALRRVTLKIPPEALVLEVGSGGNPYPRSNVLLDAYEESGERHWAALVHDRPTILSFGENLPFKDKAFDYVIAAHVLEHSPYPAKFLEELQRVACAGFIETPDAFMERINPYRDHRLEVTLRNERLVIRKKPSWICDLELVELYESNAKAIITRETIPSHAESFHVRYHWKDTIKFTIVNPDVDASWPPPQNDPITSKSPPETINALRLILLRLIRQIFSQNQRNRGLDILPLLRCPKCHSESLDRKKPAEITCSACNAVFRSSQNIFHFN